MMPEELKVGCIYRMPGYSYNFKLTKPFDLNERCFVRDKDKIKFEGRCFIEHRNGRLYVDLEEVPE